jgi:hypothetical protein
LRDALTELLSHCHADVEERAMAVNRMPTVHLVNAVVGWSLEPGDRLELTWVIPESIWPVPFDIDEGLSIY